jgi:hypothetical protein
MEIKPGTSLKKGVVFTVVLSYTQINLLKTGNCRNLPYLKRDCDRERGLITMQLL